LSSSRTDLHLILDNYATHKTPEIRRSLLHTPLPPALHPHLRIVAQHVRALARRLTTRKIKRGAGLSVRSLELDIRGGIEHWNDNPVPTYRPTAQNKSSPHSPAAAEPISAALAGKVARRNLRCESAT
jgi:hypothetical protein